MKKKFIEAGIWLALIGAIALALKTHYSRADSGDLAWILGPTAWAVACLSGISFTYETGAGYVSQSHAVIIAPACAGVNFLIIAFLMAAMLGIFRLNRRLPKAGWIAFSLAAGFGLTVLVNALRIILAMALYQADIYAGWLTHAAVHRMLGIGIYLSALYAYFYLLQHMLSQTGAAGQVFASPGNGPKPVFSLHSLLPVAIYLGMTVMVPLLNRPASIRRPEFIIHITVVLAAGIMVYAGIRFGQLCFLKFAAKIGCHEADHSHCRR
jgi:exosortase K